MSKTSCSSVLFVTTSYPRFKNDYAGGFVYRFAKYLVQSGMHVTVVCPSDKNVANVSFDEGISVKRFNYFYPRSLQMLCYDGGGIFSNLRNSWLARVQLPFFFISMIFAVFKDYKKHDVIHCHWLPTVWAVIIASLFFRHKTKVVFTNWGSDTRLLPLSLIRWTLRHVDLCISTAEETDSHLRAAGVNDYKQIMAPIDEERFNIQNVDINVFRNEIQTENPIVAFVGRLNYFKDPITFIKACAVLRESGVKFQAVLAGNGDLESKCIELIKNKNLEDCVSLLGNREDTECIMAASSVLVHISPIENTWANVIAESMFIGCPVIMTDVGYTSRTFAHNKNCLLVPPNDPPALAESIKQILTDKSLGFTIAEGARQLLVEKKKNKDSIISMLKASYNELF